MYLNAGVGGDVGPGLPVVLVERVLNADDRELLHEALVDVCQLVHVHPLALIRAGVLEVKVVLSFPVSTLFTVRVAGVEWFNTCRVEMSRIKDLLFKISVKYLLKSYNISPNLLLVNSFAVEQCLSSLQILL